MNIVKTNFTCPTIGVAFLRLGQNNHYCWAGKVVKLIPSKEGLCW